ncbi:unnamed protein product [Rotaria socialis]|uniref:MGS-like domain-containing protein n=1 Tax=Rotaria socialis TaxID=392032 RepID=A0A819CFR1_9BILA|nr:unnamed protein product [Rotaria socialis]CAF4501147.1 unnamed protein product [Rotaria socialis]
MATRALLKKQKDRPDRVETDYSMTIAMIPLNLRFLWFDEAIEEYENMRDEFCKQTNCDSSRWFNTTNKTECISYLARQPSSDKTVLISAGSLAESIVKSIDEQHKNKLHSLYIYCHNPQRYTNLKVTLSKMVPVVDIFVHPQMLITCMKENLAIESRVLLSSELHTIESNATVLPRQQTTTADPQNHQLRIGSHSNQNNPADSTDIIHIINLEIAEALANHRLTLEKKPELTLEDINKEMAASVATGKHKRIGFAAHNLKKEELVQCLKKYTNMLREHKLYATGTTGLEIQKALNVPITLFKSGPIGGDIQLAELIVTGKLDILIFLIDSLTAHAHDVDVQVLIRAARLYDIQCVTNIGAVDQILTSQWMNKTSIRKIPVTGYPEKATKSK